ncbi:MAG TPA: DUF222 domain-containing protein [Acidimicrobiales bacterium]|nr:DUF222 domain-containing protein [Acidimicrobiales bacterium]
MSLMLDGPVADLRAAIDRVLADGDSSSETIVAVHVELARLDAATTQKVGTWEASGDWRRDGARCASAWLTARCRVAPGTAGSRVKMARALRTMPATADAWQRGEISSDAAGLLMRTRNNRTAEHFERDEADLVDSARTMTYKKLSGVLTYWSMHADPDGAEDFASKLFNDRRAHLSTTFGGAVVGDQLFDPIGGAVVANVLKRIEDELFEADWAEARAAKGDAATVDDLCRTPAQRRCDAFVEMARRAGAMPAGARLPEPLFTVVVGWETFSGRLCELANGTVVTPGSLVRWLDEAWAERVVFSSPSRVIDVGVRRRLFRGATRRAIDVRDRECFHPMCEEPAEWCQGDHVLPFSADGPTTQDNGQPACRFHNRLRERERERRSDE